MHHTVTQTEAQNINFYADDTLLYTLGSFQTMSILQSAFNIHRTSLQIQNLYWMLLRQSVFYSQELNNSILHLPQPLCNRESCLVLSCCSFHLKCLDAVYHYFTCIFITRRYISCPKIGWSSQATRREVHTIVYILNPTILLYTRTNPMTCKLLLLHK